MLDQLFLKNSFLNKKERLTKSKIKSLYKTNIKVQKKIYIF